MPYIFVHLNNMIIDTHTTLRMFRDNGIYDHQQDNKRFMDAFVTQRSAAEPLQSQVLNFYVGAVSSNSLLLVDI